jgi:tetratricopeptide (TPR) repeat protein
MAFRLTDPGASDGPGPEEDPIVRWVRALQQGAPADRQRALRQLVRRRAEEALLQCLRCPDPLAVSLATAGVWECWLNERGRHARREIDRGIGLMQAAEYAEAEQVFLGLMAEFPDWAEARNKQATLLYLRGQPAVSLALCQEVVRLKPYHFGAWNGMALCAAQLGRWPQVVEYASRALEIQPHSNANLHLIQMAREHL